MNRTTWLVARRVLVIAASCALLFLFGSRAEGQRGYEMGTTEMHVEPVVANGHPLGRPAHVMVTPAELRDVRVRESIRGYHRGEMDALCARAAETIECYQRRQRELEERLGRLRQKHSAPAVDADVIQRTMLLAQRVADEAVAEAEARATSLVSEAEARAETLVTEAETVARRIADDERRRAEAEVLELGARRDDLLADVAVLERFTTEFRGRIRQAIQLELERIGLPLADLAIDPAPEASEEELRPDSAVGSWTSGNLKLAIDRGVP